MAEEHAKFKRFEYRVNSNLVLARDAAGPAGHEPTGEPETLRNFQFLPMGDLANVRNQNPELKKLQEKMKSM